MAAFPSRRCCRPAAAAAAAMPGRRLLSSSSSRRPPGGLSGAAAPAASAWVAPPMPTEGVDREAFAPVWESALDADVRGQYKAALGFARAAIEAATSGWSAPGAGRDQALRLGNHLAGVSLLRLGRLGEAARALDKAREIAVRVSSGGYGDDAYTDVGGVLVDMGACMAMQGDLDGGQKHLSRALYMAERAYRPDDDLVASASSNLAELLALKGDFEAAIKMGERALRLTDKMERLHIIKQQEEDDKGAGAGQGRRQRVGGGGSGGGAVAAGAAGTEGRTPGDAGDAIWSLPAELLALNARSITRRLNLGRLLVRCQGRPKEEGLLYVFQALQDSRKAGLRGNPILYSQCLSAAGAAHLSSLLDKGAPIDTSSLAGCTEENEVTMAAEGLLQKALSVFGPVLGERHPETVACHANLALLLPLQSGVAALLDALKGKQQPEKGQPGSSLHAGLRANHKALDALLRGLGAQEAQSKCAVDLVGGKAVGKHPPPQVLWAFNPVLGVGLRSWPDAPAKGKGKAKGKAKEA